MTELGFCEVPDVEYVKLFVVAREDGYPWGFSRKKPCTDKAIKAQIQGVEITEGEFKGEKKDNLEVTIQADRKYTLISGLTTTFSRGLLLGLRVHFGSNNFHEPIVIAPQLSEEGEKIVFCNLYSSDQRIYYTWDKDIDPVLLVQELRKFFRQAQEVVQKEALSQLPNTPVQSPLAEETSPPQSSSEVTFSKIVTETNVLLKKLGWTPERGRQFLIDKYGKRSRQLLDDAEFLGFLNYLREAAAGHPSPSWKPIERLEDVFKVPEGDNWDDSIPF